jgi:hypothetical protein
MSKKKEINTLIKLARKFGNAWCDVGTFKERKSKHLIMKWKYKGNPFMMTFPLTPSAPSATRNCYAQVRRKLKEIGLDAPPEFSVKLMGNVEQQELLEEMWGHLGTDEDE